MPFLSNIETQVGSTYQRLYVRFVAPGTFLRGRIRRKKLNDCAALGFKNIIIKRIFFFSANITCRWNNHYLVTRGYETHAYFAFSKNQPLGRFFLVVAMSICPYVHMYIYIYVSSPCDFFRGLSLALRSHDQIPTSHWSSPLIFI